MWALGQDKRNPIEDSVTDAQVSGPIPLRLKTRGQRTLMRATHTQYRMVSPVERQIQALDRTQPGLPMKTAHEDCP